MNDEHQVLNTIILEIVGEFKIVPSGMTVQGSFIDFDSVGNGNPAGSAGEGTVGLMCQVNGNIRLGRR